MQKSIAYLLVGGLCLFQGIASAAVTVYSDEAIYLNALASLGYSTHFESFEGVEWDSVRTTSPPANTAPSILSQGITWTTNHPLTNEITTGPGAVKTGLWAVYDPNHGDPTGTIAECDVVTPPLDCFAHDGFSGSMAAPGTIYGVGGFIVGFVGADVDIIIDGVAHNGGTLSVSEHQFMGVIDTTGFNTFEFRELEGQVEQLLFIFGDDFTIATSSILPVNNAPVANAGADQNVNENDTVTLDGSASSDADSDPLTYNWALTSIPSGSSATLSSSTAVMPTFVADLPGDYVAQLVVNDGTENSSPDSVTVTTDNVAPVANAGSDQSVAVNTQVTLDGSASSDVDGDPLVYSWSFVSRPVGSSASLTDTAAVMPVFTVDVAGSYNIQLVVNDGQLDSAVDNVIITTTNVAPIANAGADQSAAVNTTVTLNGIDSSDADGDPLSYSWSLSSPAGSSASLSNSTAVTTDFMLDVAGIYTAELIVNDGTEDSAPDTVIVNTSNIAPVANAGPDQSVALNDVATLDGSGSSDANSDLLTYNWSFIIKPVGSTARLSSTTDVMPGFQVDVAGAYIVQLIVNDGMVDSAADSVLLSTANVAPVASAGVDQDVMVNDLVVLDGSASSDANNDLLSFSWSLSSRPVGSTASLSSLIEIMPTFEPDLEGSYIVQLLVSDGTADSDPDVVNINVTASTTTSSGGSGSGSVSIVQLIFSGILMLLIPLIRGLLKRMRIDAEI